MSPCPRVWEVEAERDGRLDGSARERSQKHRKQCLSCREEQERLEGLSALLLAAEKPTLDELGAKRLRSRILSDANAGVLREPKSSPRVRLGIAAVAALALMALGARYATREAPASSAALALTDEGGGRYDRTVENGVDHVTLHEGAMAFRVDHKAGHSRLLVHVPDGEIEDIGTIFHVTVKDGRTALVRVDEGRVVVRTTSAGEHGIVVSAGESWEPPRSSGGTRAAPHEEPSASPAPSPASPPSASSVAVVPGHGTPSTSVAPVPALPHASPKAVATVTPGSSSSGEDAAYLGVLSLIHQGKRDAAKAAARRYVVLYPNGLRRKEMDVVAE